VDLPGNGDDDWVALCTDVLPVATAAEWVVLPSCGGQVLFTGTVRDHAEDRPGVSLLEYEAYSEVVVPKLRQLAAQARRQWPELGRVVLWHRTGRMGVGEVAVVVAVSAPHRAEAFEAARWSIDTLKATIPIWKRETWDGGSDWGTGAQAVTEVGS
jgi:molybdopterin synthase catalytic subunit